ncbi:MAG: DNA repair protein RecN, partial [bacterium]
MLEYLSIRGFAIIDELQLPFHPGLTVLTGETGAGKSIIVDALQAVLGEKVDLSVVRAGESGARVEAAFRAPEIDLPEGYEALDELIIGREIRREGRGRSTVNGAMITIAHLKEIGECMVDLHGQHEHQSLLRTSVHLDALDSFASLVERRQEFAGLFQELTDVRNRIAAVERGEKDRLARLDYLRYVTQELQAAGLVPDEEPRLLEEERILGAAEKLLATAFKALEDIYQGEGSVAETVRKRAGDLKQLVKTDGRLSEVVALLDEAGVQLEEAGHFLRDYAASVQADPRRLDEIHERLGLIATLKKKYGPSMEEVLKTLADAEAELTRMEEGEEDQGALRSRETALAARSGDLARKLSLDRKERASSLESAVRKELADLAMDKVRFEVSFQDTSMNETGIDEVQFLISPNPGEPLMPLRKIASGGELSRVMLALKRILAGADAIGTLVFDEVDAGIGGRVAAVLGLKLQEIARHHQVLCITHLAPVAAYAHHHIVVEKFEERGRTVV